MIYKEEICNLLYYERSLHKWLPLLMTQFTFETLDFGCAIPKEYSKPCSVSLGDSMPAVLNTAADKKRPYSVPVSSDTRRRNVYTVKKVIVFPIPSRDVTTP